MDGWTIYIEKITEPVNIGCLSKLHLVSDLLKIALQTLLKMDTMEKKRSQIAYIRIG